MSIIDTLMALATTVRNEKKKEANSAIRIGDLFLAIIDFIKGLVSGQIRQPAVDTYNDTTGGKTSLLSKYPNPQVGWDVLVREENTRYNWNGSMWVNMETGVYGDTVATKDDIGLFALGLSSTIVYTNAPVDPKKGDIVKLSVSNISMGSDIIEVEAYIDTIYTVVATLNDENKNAVIDWVYTDRKMRFRHTPRTIDININLGINQPKDIINRTDILNTNIVDLRHQVNTDLGSIDRMLTWSQGGFDGAGKDIDSSIRIRTQSVLLPKGKYPVLYNSSYILFVNKNSANSDVLNGATIDLTGDTIVRFGLRKVDDSDVTPSEITAVGISVIKDGTPIALSTKASTAHKEELTFTLENGTFNGADGNVTSTSRIRTNRISLSEESMCLIIIPETLKCTANVNNGSGRISRASFQSFSVRSSQYIRLSFGRNDGTPLQLDNLTEDELSNIKIIRISTKSNEYDITIAASDSLQSYKDKADIVCDGSNDTSILQAAIASYESVKILLYDGIYNINKMHTTPFGEKSALATSTVTMAQDGTMRLVQIHGYRKGRMDDANTVILKVTGELHDSLSLMDECALILAPRAGAELETTQSYKTAVEIEGVTILGYETDKPICYIDSTQAESVRIKDVTIRTDGNISGVPRRPHLPNEKLVGIRVGHGSNRGYQNYIKNCMVVHCATGVSCNGEHFVFEDVLVHSCSIGWYFGDKLTRSNFGHPNVMIGCSIESCGRLMVLSRYGETAESENTDAILTLICIGLSTENHYLTPGGAEAVDATTLPIKEITKGLWRGRVEADEFNSNGLFENDGSGKNMQWKIYSNYDSNADKGETSQRPRKLKLLPVGYPFFDTTLNKMIYSDGSKWIDAMGNNV